MDCREARELLAEEALSALPNGESRSLQEHLRWCAGCRRESAELHQGTEVLASAASTQPPPGLEDRVVSAVVREARRGRRPRSLVVVAAAAALVVVGLAGWGAAMAGRAERLENAAEIAREEAAAAAREFGLLVQDVGGDGPVREAVLVPVGAGPAGGRALLYDADVENAANWVLVFVGGLPEEGGPYVARVIGEVDRLVIGRMWPSTDDRLAAYRLFGGSAEGYETLEILDANGSVVLRGAFPAR